MSSRKNSKQIDEPVIIIPAYNEEKNIARTIRLIKKTGIRAKIIVVDDGSKDRTAEIAKKEGAVVVRLKKNVGKANAFFAGLKKALEISPKASCIVTIDADMISVPKEALEKLISRASEETKKGKIKMIIAPVYERIGDSVIMCSYFYSGIRAFSLQAAWHLRTSEFKGIPKGYGLEYFLNGYFIGYGEVLPTAEAVAFVAKKAYRKLKGKETQRKEENITRERMEKRLRKLQRHRLR